MLPGVLAGQYAPEAIQIDLAQLCQSAGARFVLGAVSGVDRAGRHVHVAGHGPVAFDVLSIGLGSVPTMAGVRVDDVAPVLPIKPMQTFLTRLNDALGRIDPSSRVRITVVGGGAAGVEVALTLPVWVRATLGPRSGCTVTIVTAGDSVLPGSGTSARRRAARVLRSRQVCVQLGASAVGITATAVTLADGSTVPTDLAVWTTGAAPPPVIRDLGLPLDADGFLETRETLQTTGDTHVFAVGDTGRVSGSAMPRAGVHAVRQGPVLWSNILHVLEGTRLASFVPQGDFLRLLNTGDGRAIAEWRSRSAEGRWCFLLKDWIDRRFLAPYQYPQP